jgi:hypothetical protein
MQLNITTTGLVGHVSTTNDCWLKAGSDLETSRNTPPFRRNHTPLTAQFRFITETNGRELTSCINVSYVVGHKRVNSLLFQHTASIVHELIIFGRLYKTYTRLYKGGGFRFTVSASYSWKMPLNIGHDLTIRQHVGLERNTGKKLWTLTVRKLI